METCSILYVDDEKDNLTVFQSRFRKYFRVLTAESAKEGLEIIERDNVGIVISDQRMPETSGIHFLEQIRVRYPDIIRIVLTAYTDSEDIIDAINKGAVYSYVVKPWDGDELLGVIERSFAQRNLRIQSREKLELLHRAFATVGHFSPELKRLMLEHAALIQQAAVVTNYTEASKSIARLNHSFSEVQRLVNEEESTFAAAVFDQLSQAVNVSGLITDEPLSHVMGRFPNKARDLSHLYFTDEDFRQLCIDYYDCTQRSHHLLWGESDAEIQFLKAALEHEIRNAVMR